MMFFLFNLFFRFFFLLLLMRLRFIPSPAIPPPVLWLPPISPAGKYTARAFCVRGPGEPKKFVSNFFRAGLRNTLETPVVAIHGHISVAVLWPARAMRPLIGHTSLSAASAAARSPLSLP
jgi:hypothetical protein